MVDIAFHRACLIPEVVIGVRVPVDCVGVKVVPKSIVSEEINSGVSGERENGVIGVLGGVEIKPEGERRGGARLGIDFD